MQWMRLEWLARVTGVVLTYEWEALWLSTAGVKMCAIESVDGPNTEGDEVAAPRAPATLLRPSVGTDT